MNRREFSKAFIWGSSALPLLRAGFSRGEAAAAVIQPVQLKAVSRTIDVNGRAAKVFGLVQPDGTHGLRFGPGQDFNVALSNETGESTLIHWHGLTPPWPMDGVPDQPAPMLKPGETRAYSFPLNTPGTHWMHAHTLQEQALLAAPLIVRTADDQARDEQEVVVLLHDFSFAPPEEILAKLRPAGTAGLMSDSGMKGIDHSEMPAMNMGASMMQMDINDYEYDAYLANDRTLKDPETVQVEKGGRVRLRIINGATATAFTIDTGSLSGEVIAVDGQDVVPFKTRQFPLAMGQRVDIRLPLPHEGGAFPILFLREGAIQRTGIILATSGAIISKVAETGKSKGPILALDMETRLVAARPLAKRTVSRSLSVNLVGDMQKYQWAMQSDTDLKVVNGERVTIEMKNQTMMMHPMHLHGHHFQIVAVNGQELDGALRDTVFVPPMASVTFAFDAVNPGKAWAFHCHHLYHMATGMITFVPYEDA